MNARVYEDTARAEITFVDAVIKVGGGLLSQPGALEQIATALVGAGRRHRILVVPGGGPFADAIREVDCRAGLSADAAHWMAILAMEQFAHLLASKIAGTVLVERPGELPAAYQAGGLPILAPFRWIREVDPLPHSWQVTSDSIAAWIAGVVGARRLVLVKPVAGDPTRMVDGYFWRALPAGMPYCILAAAEAGGLEPLLLQECGVRNDSAR